MADIIDESLPLDTDLAGYGAKNIRDSRVAINDVKIIADAALPKTGGAITGLLDISASGAGQIKFPATQNPSSDANTLDDYEESEITPYIEGSTSAGTGTYSLQDGRCVKIGKLVVVYGRIDISGHTGTGDMLIKACPFVANGNYPVSITLDCITFSGSYISGLTGNGDGIIYVYSMSSGGFMTVIPIDTAGSIYFSCTYITSN